MSKHSRLPIKETAVRSLSTIQIDSTELPLRAVKNHRELISRMPRADKRSQNPYQSPSNKKVVFSGRDASTDLLKTSNKFLKKDDSIFDYSS